MAFWDQLLRGSVPSPECLASAEALMERGEYEGARGQMRPALRGARGVFAARLLANLGECEFQLGDAAQARATTGKALHLAEGAKENDLVASVHGNLYEIDRYLGDSPSAAGQAERLAELARASGNEPEARRYLRQGTLVREGEPLLRVVADVGGQRHEIDEVLAGVAGPVRLVFVRNRLTLRLAERWTRGGEELAQAGSFGPAVDLYRRAARLDGFAPEPAYEWGLARGHEGQWDQAREQLDRAQRLAPGWFFARSALALLRDGLRSELFRTWHAVAEGPLPAEAKRQLCEQLLAVAPPPARGYIYHLHGKALQGLKRPGAERLFRLGLEHAVEADLVTRLCVDLAAVVGSGAEKARLLHRALEIGGDLVAVATAKIVLAFE